MSRFLDPLRIEQVGWRHGRPVWITLHALRYRSVRLGATLVIPAEFITDLASVPRAPLAYLIAGGRGNRSGVIHDFPYQFGYWWIESGDGSLLALEVERPLGDWVFHESLLADPMSGAGRPIAWQMWASVRIGGRGVWADDERSTALNPVWSATEWPGRIEA